MPVPEQGARSDIEPSALLCGMAATGRGAYAPLAVGAGKGEDFIVELVTMADPGSPICKFGQAGHARGAL